MAPPLELAAANEQENTSESGGNILDLVQLSELLLFNNREMKQRLKLNDPARRLIHQGTLRHKSKKKEYKLFLFDHALIITKPKVIDGRERLHLVDHPTPIQLLQVSSEQTRPNILGFIPLPRNKVRHQLRFLSHGKRFNREKPLILLSPTADVAQAWVENVDAQRDTNRRSTESNALSLGQDMLVRQEHLRVNCAALYDNNQIIVYGTDDGVYFQAQNAQSRKLIDLTNVQQIDVLEDLLLLVVLAAILERSVFTFPLDALDLFDRMNRAVRLSRAQVSFFKVGLCMDRTVVCMVKTASLSSTVKILESVGFPAGSNLNRNVETSFKDTSNRLKIWKDFYLPAELYSVQFLKTKLCVAGSAGFEVVDLETLDTQVLLDPADNALNFVGQYKNPRPLDVYRVGDEFLVCYREFAFYVNKTGWKSDKNVIIYWEGTPIACGEYSPITQQSIEWLNAFSYTALHYPYIIAFSQDFVEIRHVDDGSLVQVMHKAGVRCLYTKHSPSQTNIGHHRLETSPSTLVSIEDRVMFLTLASD
ncbi:Rho guanine nucleotide exchange factor [Rhizoctonia solani]|uniref:Rho guanine nucleotide exchange factor n=1 Tax=Rhizoctonia solani TaxID=456999 RepID=A0A8H8NS82_9AGAM|nr:Rho guanine nucleotide exchange factor [Rhizoctonia solani]QRW17282.1 Rho guanine nucleotide exchange factor [Rhizoctonia solani]